MHIDDAIAEAERIHSITEFPWVQAQAKGELTALRKVKSGEIETDDKRDADRFAEALAAIPLSEQSVDFHESTVFTCPLPSCARSRKNSTAIEHADDCALARARLRQEQE